MARLFKVVIKLEKVEERHLPALIEAMQKGGRVLHADAMFIFGSDPPPHIVMYGEDLAHDENAGQRD